MLFYTPDTHTGDKLMSSWFAREGARLGNQRVEGFKMSVLRR